MTIVVYKRYTDSEILADAKDAIKNITQWFKDNPKRKICRVQLWYNKTVHVKRDSIAKQINKAADEACKK